MRRAGVRRAVDGFDAHLLHQRPDVLAPTLKALELEHFSSMRAPAKRGGSAKQGIRISEISASMGDKSRLPRSRSNEKTPP